MNRRTFLKTVVGALIGGGLAVTASRYYAYNIEPGRLTVETVQVPLTGLPPALEGLKIVQLSDLHLHPFTQIELIEQAVTLANHLQPDLVVLTGDYVLQEPESIFELAPVLADLATRYGVFAVYGNHDLWLPRNQAILERGFGPTGITVLQNRGVVVPVGRDQLYLAGVDDVLKGRPDLTAALQDWSPGVPVILLVHEPDVADQVAADDRIKLQLSGHSHGGQVRLPGFGALRLPELGQKYDQGLYRVKDLWLYTNRGLGLLGPPVRFNCPPEITELILVAA